jgi:protein subunit release factor B
MRKQTKCFTLTRKDFDVHFYVGSGNGGQKKQKTSSACRIVHRASGAEGKSQDSRKQSENQALAFKRMTETKEFKVWMKIQQDIILGNIKYEEADANGIFHDAPLKAGETYE